LRAALGEAAWDDAWTACRRARPIEGAFTANADARRFTAFLRDEVLPRLAVPAAVSDVVAYEEAKLEVSSAPPSDGAQPATPPSDIDFRYPLLRQPSRLLRLRHDGGSPTWILVYRSPSGTVASAKLGRRPASVLERCDGSKTAVEVS
jgi:hypothetical protein